MFASILNLLMQIQHLCHSTPCHLDRFVATLISLMICHSQVTMFMN